MDKPLLYRRGTREDIAALKELALIAYGEFEKVLSKDNYLKMQTSQRDEKKIEHLITIGKVFVCICEGKIVGMVYFIPAGNPTELCKAEWSYIRLLGVHPDYRGRGIAKTLMQTCVDYAIKSNENTIALHTSEFMDTARTIYERMGFKVYKEINNIFDKKYWLYTFDLNYKTA